MKKKILTYILVTSIISRAFDQRYSVKCIKLAQIGSFYGATRGRAPAVAEASQRGGIKSKENCVSLSEVPRSDCEG
jgi:hypothetical protein